MEKFDIKNLSFTSIHHSNGGYVAINIFLALCGLLFVIFPGMTVTTVSKALGLALGVTGILEVCVFFIRELQNKSRGWDFSFSMLFLLSGITILLYPSLPIYVIPFALALFAFANSLAAGRNAFFLKKKNAPLAFTLMGISLISTVLGAVSILRPFTVAKVFAVLLGISIFLSGILKAVIRLVKRYSKDDEPEPEPEN